MKALMLAISFLLIGQSVLAVELLVDQIYGNENLMAPPPINVPRYEGPITDFRSSRTVMPLAGYDNGYIITSPDVGRTNQIMLPMPGYSGGWLVFP